MANSTPHPSAESRGYDPFSRLYDILIDIQIREKERRAALTEAERDAEDFARAEKHRREETKWLAEHEKTVTIRIDTHEDSVLKMSLSPRDRQRLRDEGYRVDVPEGAQAFFRAIDHKFYPLADYEAYDRTGTLPTAEPFNPIAEHFGKGLIARMIERKDELLPPAPAPPPAPTLTREEEVQRLVDRWEENQRRRAKLTVEEREAEDRERQAEVQAIVAEAEEEQRTFLSVRREAEANVRKFKRAELRAKGYQPLFVLRRDDRDVYFQAHDGKWYRIEAYPEYDRSAALPAVSFAAPPTIDEPSVLDEAVERARAIIAERKRPARQAGAAR
jgi:hypothetical protein